MRGLHDPGVQGEMERRIGALTPASERKWGKMTPDQMLWHCSEAIEAALGSKPYPRMGFMPPLPKSWIKWMLLNVPWIKGRTPTAPGWVARERYDFEAERARLLDLVGQLVARNVEDDAALHPAFGKQSVGYQSQLQCKHLNHHLEQFGV